jgi:hypothetical protein
LEGLGRGKGKENEEEIRKEGRKGEGRRKREMGGRGVQTEEVSKCPPSTGHKSPELITRDLTLCKIVSSPHSSSLPLSNSAFLSLLQEGLHVS